VLPLLQFLSLDYSLLIKLRIDDTKEKIIVMEVLVSKNAMIHQVIINK